MKNNLQKNIQWIIKDKYGGKTSKNLIKDIKRLRSGEPLDYVIGWIPFLNCKIDLSLKPFIPRPETEFWIEKFINLTKNSKKMIKILDVFAGSGCLGIAVLRDIRKSKVDFAEINSKFIKQIKINLKINRITATRFQVKKSDLFNNIKEKYDYILANPPYVPLKNKKKVSSVIKYEPAKAVFGKQDGLFYITKFLNQVKNHLKKNGQIWLEFDSPQKNKLEKMLAKDKIYQAKFYHDQYNRWRWVVLY